MSNDRYSDMLTAVQRFHDKHKFRESGGEDLPYRVALMAEELGEISACITKGKTDKALAEECADLLILLIGTALYANLDLIDAFWQKMEKNKQRPSRIIDVQIRVSDFGI